MYSTQSISCDSFFVKLINCPFYYCEFNMLFSQYMVLLLLNISYNLHFIGRHVKYLYQKLFIFIMD
jgi:hypothetical protein